MERIDTSDADGSSQESQPPSNQGVGKMSRSQQGTRVLVSCQGPNREPMSHMERIDTSDSDRSKQGLQQPPKQDVGKLLRSRQRTHESPDVDMLERMQAPNSTSQKG